MSKYERQGLKSPSACEGMEGPGEPQQTTAVDGFSHADCKTSADEGRNLFFQAEFGMDLE